MYETIKISSRTNFSLSKIYLMICYKIIFHFIDARHIYINDIIILQLAIKHEIETKIWQKIWIAKNGEERGGIWVFRKFWCSFPCTNRLSNHNFTEKFEGAYYSGISINSMNCCNMLKVKLHFPSSPPFPFLFPLCYVWIKELSKKKENPFFLSLYAMFG